MKWKSFYHRNRSVERICISAEPAMAQDSESSSKLEVKAGAGPRECIHLERCPCDGSSFQPSPRFQLWRFFTGSLGALPIWPGGEWIWPEYCLFHLRTYPGADRLLRPVCSRLSRRFSCNMATTTTILELNAGFDFAKSAKKFASLCVSANVNLVNDKDENDDAVFPPIFEFGIQPRLAAWTSTSR